MPPILSHRLFRPENLSNLSGREAISIEEAIRFCEGSELCDIQILGRCSIHIPFDPNTIKTPDQYRALIADLFEKLTKFGIPLEPVVISDQEIENELLHHNQTNHYEIMLVLDRKADISTLGPQGVNLFRALGPDGINLFSALPALPESSGHDA